MARKQGQTDIGIVAWFHDWGSQRLASSSGATKLQRSVLWPAAEEIVFFIRDQGGESHLQGMTR